MGAWPTTLWPLGHWLPLRILSTQTAGKGWFHYTIFTYNFVIMLCTMHLTWRFLGCPALHTNFLGINDVSIRQPEVSKGNLILPPWSLRRIPLGVYWTSLLAATSSAGPMLWSWDRWESCQLFPLCWVCQARTCCWPVLTTVKSCTSTYTHTHHHPSLEIPASFWGL